MYLIYGVIGGRFCDFDDRQLRFIRIQSGSVFE